MGSRRRSGGWRWSRCARSGWSRTAGGLRNPCKGATSSWCSLTAATSLSSAKPHQTGRAHARPRINGSGSGTDGSSMGYVELHCHSAYSFLDGASDPAEQAAAAAALGHETLALTDHDNVCGAMEFAHACKGVGVRPIFGCELTVEVPRRLPKPVHVTLLGENAKGWASLCRLITAAHRGTREGKGMREPLPPSLPIDELERHTEGLVCLSGCARDGAVAGTWERGDPAAAAWLARRLLRAFGPDGFRIELQRPLWRRDRSRNRWL